MSPDAGQALGGQPLARRKADFCRGRGSLRFTALRPHHPRLLSKNRLAACFPRPRRRPGAWGPCPDLIIEKRKRTANPRVGLADAGAQGRHDGADDDRFSC